MAFAGMRLDGIVPGWARAELRVRNTSTGPHAHVIHLESRNRAYVQEVPVPPALVEALIASNAPRRLLEDWLRQLEAAHHH